MNGVGRLIRSGVGSERILLRRWTGADPRVPNTVFVSGQVLDERPSDLAGDQGQATGWLRITDAEIRRHGWPGPPAEHDEVEIVGRIYEVLGTQSRRLSPRETVHVLSIKG